MKIGKSVFGYTISGDVRARTNHHIEGSTGGPRQPSGVVCGHVDGGGVVPRHDMEARRLRRVVPSGQPSSASATRRMVRFHRGLSLEHAVASRQGLAGGARTPDPRRHNRDLQVRASMTRPATTVRRTASASEDRVVPCWQHRQARPHPPRDRCRREQGLAARARRVRGRRCSRRCGSNRLRPRRRVDDPRPRVLDRS